MRHQVLKSAFKSVIEDSSKKQLRLFVAITVPDAVRREMVRVQRELQPLAPRGAVRWTRPEQFHLTLRFLGDVSSDHVADLQQSLRVVCASAPVLLLRARGIGFFPHARSPRVIWIGTNDANNLLANLQEKIEGAVRPFTKEQGGEQFAGHATLGRFKQINRLEIRELTSYVETMKDRVFGEWTARQIEIIHSELLPDGAKHSELAAFRLGES